MLERQITCIIKPNTSSQHEHITHVGNSALGWILTREEVIRRIDGNIEKFYVVDSRSKKKAYVGVRRVPGRAAFIQTYADGDWNNNLLSLGQCPLKR